MFDTYAQIFEERANLYDAAMALAPGARAAEFSLAFDRLPLRPGLKVADLPAGGGYLWTYLRGRGVDYVAVEPSQVFFDRIPREEGVTALRSPIVGVELADAGVDALVTLAGLHHEPDLAAAFAEFRRILRPSGLAVVIDAQAGTSSAEFLNGFVNDNNPMGHDGTFFDDRTAELLAVAGFELLEDEIHDLPWRFADEELMGEFLRLLFGATEATPAEVGAAAKAQLGIRPDPEGVALSWPLRRLICR